MTEKEKAVSMVDEFYQLKRERESMRQDNGKGSASKTTVLRSTSTRSRVLGRGRIGDRSH